MKINKTALGVIAFIVGLILAAAASREAKAESQMHIELGRTTFNQHLTTGGVGVRFNREWDAQVRILGEGQTKKGYQDAAFNYSISRVFNPGWRVGRANIKMRIGVVYSPDVLLVGDFNYRLGVICNFYEDLFEIEIGHDSSADTFETNTGVDAIFLRMFL
jgi:hypothetical protein